ncbi:MAG: RNA 2',3'-cyclic phosphodiesterase [Bacteroidales bacterium]|nr:RNA 2',3'-cyclic phosphodiesterase [Bacteroidales bacterium]
MKRLFTAIKLHPTPRFLEIFHFLKENLQPERIKWVEEYNVHLTLKFFGETEEQKIPGIRKALSEATKNTLPIEIELKGTGIFGSSYNPRVIWFGIEPNPELQHLYGNIWKELDKLGYVPDSQNFVPHLTIGRIKYLADKRFFQEVIHRYRQDFIQRETVKELILFESILRPEGPVYKIIECFPFH